MSDSGAAPIDTIAAALVRERHRAGLSAAEVARRAGIAKSTVSQLESATGNPSIETLWAISTALGIPFSRLVALPHRGVQLIRAGQAPSVGAEQATYRVSLLSACPPNARRDVYVITAEPGKSRDSEPHAPGVVEHVVLAAGRASVGMFDDPVDLEPGDYLAYPGDERHTFRALVPGTIAVLVSEHV